MWVSYKKGGQTNEVQPYTTVNKSSREEEIFRVENWVPVSFHIIKYRGISFKTFCENVSRDVTMTYLCMFNSEKNSVSTYKILAS